MDLYLYQKGRLVDESYAGCNLSPCDEVMSVGTNTDEYILNVRGYHNVDETYTATLQVVSP